MTITPRQAELVRATWDQIQAQSTDCVELFYQRLFELDPRLRALFRSDMEEQQRKFADMLNVTIRHMDRTFSVVPAVLDMGIRHAGYGVREADYDTVGRALLWAVEQVLGGGFDEEVATAWDRVYDNLARTMKEAAPAGG